MDTSARDMTPSPSAAELAATIGRVERELRDATSTRPHNPARLAEALEAAVAAAQRWPQAADVFDAAELLGELSEAYETAGRTDDALQAMLEAITAGYRGRPDPRVRLAEILLRADRPTDAHPILAQVKTDTPDDVWLYNNAGLEYGHAGDHTRALDWLTDGLELAIRTGDPERLVAQLSDLRRENLAALGRDHDDLDARAETFLAQPPPTRHPRGGTTGDRPAPFAAPNTTTAPPAAGRAMPERPDRVQMTFSWFPAAEFATALHTWPELAKNWGATDHTDYCRRLQRHIAEIHNAAAAPGPAWIVPIRIDAFRGWCARTGHDSGTGAARASYAAERTRTAAGDDVILWPPSRNTACWCGSGRKYKQCCGHPRNTTAEQS